MLRHSNAPGVTKGDLGKLPGKSREEVITQHLNTGILVNISSKNRHAWRNYTYESLPRVVGLRIYSLLLGRDMVLRYPPLAIVKLSV